MQTTALDTASIRRALDLGDLTNPQDGLHAIQLIIRDFLNALQSEWRCELKVYRESPIVSVSDNYDALHYPSDGAARDARYTRYVCDTALLRTMTSALVPKAMRSVAGAPWDDILLACPGIVYRRDCIDRLHTGEPHQIDLWRVSRRGTLTSNDMGKMISLVVEAALPGAEWRTETKVHPYTIEGLQIDILQNDEWIEIGECGLAHPEIIRENLREDLTGLAMGLGLDRILILRKGIKDIRLLRAADPRITEQMGDLKPYREVSMMPAVTRDLSIVLDEMATGENLGDRVREALGSDADVVESVEILSETSCQELPPVAVERLGILQGQKNILLRAVFRALDRTLTHEECNDYRDTIYKALHEGTVWQWAPRATQVSFRTLPLIRIPNLIILVTESGLLWPRTRPDTRCRPLK